MNGLSKILKTAAFTTAIIALLAATAFAQRVKDVARVKSSHINKLVGIGLVVGLGGNGEDTAQVREMVANFYNRLGVTVSSKDVKAKNVAAVTLQVDLKSDLKLGATFDVQISSIGEAKSLEGGTLLKSYIGVFNPLTAKLEPYAIASGKVTVSSQTIKTGGVVKNGGIIEKEIPVTLSEDGKTIKWVLDEPDYRTAEQVASAFRDAYYDLVNRTEVTDVREVQEFAHAINKAEVVVKIPEEYRNDLVKLIAILESRTVTGVDVEARVVINMADHSVAINGNVKVSPCLICVEGVEIEVPATEPTQANPETERVVGVASKNNSANIGVSLTTLKDVLNKIGVSNTTLVKVIQRMHEIGVLHAKLEVR